MKNNYFDDICGIQVCPSCGYSVKAGIIWPIGEEECHVRRRQFKSSMGYYMGL